MKFRKWTSGLLAAALLATISGTALAEGPTVPGAVYSDFTAAGSNMPVSQIQENLTKAGIQDVKPTDWFAGSVSVLVEAGLIAPDANGNVKPDKEITASEGLAVFAKVLGIASKTDTAEEAMAKAQQAGLVDGTISADVPMSRLEFAKVLAKALGVSGRKVTDASTYPFRDYDQVSQADREILAALYDLGVFKGNENREFMPSGVLTTAQLAILIDRILGAH